MKHIEKSRNIAITSHINNKACCEYIDRKQPHRTDLLEHSGEESQHVEDQKTVGPGGQQQAQAHQHSVHNEHRLTTEPIGGVGHQKSSHQHSEHQDGLGGLGEVAFVAY